MILFVTGTDTGIGKTVLAAAWVRHLQAAGAAVVGLKPVCSGGRGDARALWKAAGRALPLDEVNPWWYRPAVAPVVAARRMGQAIRLSEVVSHIRRAASGFSVVLVEGAGGWLSPVGEDFDNRDLQRALRAVPVVVAPNRLGVVNQVRLVWEALGAYWAETAVAVLMDPARPARLAVSNVDLLEGYLGAGRVIRFPWLSSAAVAGEGKLPRQAQRALTALGQRLGLERP